MPVGLSPVPRKISITEPAAGALLQIVEFAEVVCVQLQQIGNDRIQLRRGGNEFEMRYGLLCASSYHGDY